MTASGDFVGSEIGRYRIVSTLGRGGMGEVYDAFDSSLDRHVAVKILSADAVADPRRVARFIQEARAASALNHPHVVSIHEIGEDGGVHFIAMERVDGSTLRKIFASGRLPVSRSIEILAQVADAVAAAHAAGIVHRDLKPENIMVSRDGYAKVLDFGLAKLQAETILEEPDSATMMRMTESGTVLGTVGYMSPEQAQGKRVDARSDIFSLGCILYEAIAGRRAFHAPTSIDTLHKILHEEPQPLREIVPDLAPELLRIVRKTMSKDPDQRYHSAKDLTLDLRMLVREGSATEAVRTSDRPRRGMSPLALIAIAAVLLGMAAAGVLLWRRSASPPPPTVTAFQRITAKGSLITTRVSPDGRFLAYAQKDDGPGVSIWIRQLATGEDLQIVPRLSGFILGCTFTPDSSAIVYAIRSEDEPRGAFYRVATIGGVPQRVGTGTDSAPAFSPDGKRMAWLLDAYPKPDQSALMVGNSDGSAVRVLAVRRFPEIFAPISFARPAWSPDGRMIAASVKRLLSHDSAAVIGFDPESGSEHSLSDAHWVSVSAIEWLPDQSGIVAIAAADAASIHATSKTGSQIWLIPHPSGTPRRITNDTLYYREVSVTADGKNLVADLADATVHLWRRTIDNSEPARRISTGHYDGVAGVSMLPDGRVVFTSTERGTTTLWLMSADGSGRRQLLRNPYREEYPMAFAGGIAFVATTPAATELCVTNNDGEGRRVIARPIDDSPVAVSPDGRFFVYSVHDRLWQVSADGKQRIQVTRTPAYSPVYSPTGDRLGFISLEPAGKHLTVVDARTLAVAWRSSPLRSSSSPRWLRWAPDGKGLLLSAWGPVQLFPFDGESGRVADFGDTTWSFDVSRDNVLFVSRGTVTRDAVMITNFR